MCEKQTTPRNWRRKKEHRRGKLRLQHVTHYVLGKGRGLAAVVIPLKDAPLEGWGRRKRMKGISAWRREGKQLTPSLHFRVISCRCVGEYLSCVCTSLYSYLTHLILNSPYTWLTSYLTQLVPIHLIPDSLHIWLTSYLTPLIPNSPHI